MSIDWAGVTTIFLAIILASLVEHMLIAPNMEHSPPHVPFATPQPVPHDAASYVNMKYPGATTVSSS